MSIRNCSTDIKSKVLLQSLNDDELKDILRKIQSRVGASSSQNPDTTPITSPANETTTTPTLPHSAFRNDKGFTWPQENNPFLNSVSDPFSPQSTSLPSWPHFQTSRTENSALQYTSSQIPPASYQITEPTFSLSSPRSSYLPHITEPPKQEYFVDRWQKPNKSEIITLPKHIYFDKLPNNRSYFDTPAPASNIHDNFQMPIETKTFSRSDVPSHNPYMTSRDQHSGFSLSKSISQIPNFDGNPDKLPLFGAVVRKILHRFPNNEEDILFGLANKLIGRAADGSLTILHQYNSVE